MFVYMNKKSSDHSVFCAGSQSTFYFLSHFCRLASLLSSGLFFVSPAHHILKRIKKGSILPRRGFCLPNNPTDMLLSEALAVCDCKILQRQSSTGVLEAFF